MTRSVRRSVGRSVDWSIIIFHFHSLSTFSDHFEDPLTLPAIRELIHLRQDQRHRVYQQRGSNCVHNIRC